jgi:hypothetical protein
MSTYWTRRQVKPRKRGLGERLFNTVYNALMNTGVQASILIGYILFWLVLIVGVIIVGIHFIHKLW